MIPLTVHHRTAYRYRRLVDLWPHRLMLCPRESRDLQVISCVVTVSPTAQVTWAHDVFGNAVATAVFEAASDSLVIDSVVELRLEASAWPIFNIAASAIVYPFRYSDDEWMDLGSLTAQQYPDPPGRLATWARAFVRGDQTDTLALLKDLCAGVSRWISYQSREDEGTQSPIQDLGPRLGLLPRSRRAVRRSGAQPGGSAQGWSQATCSTPIRCFTDRRTPDQRTPGPKSSSRAPGGSASTRRTAASAARTLFLSLSRATYGKRRPSPEPMREAATRSRA